MTDHLSLSNLKRKTVLVLGYAKSGKAAAHLLAKNGARVFVNDAKPYGELIGTEELEAIGIEFVTGGHPLRLFDESLHLIVKNPGIRYDNPIVQEGMRREVPIVTELELAYWVVRGELVAITGSNGKTTTTKLVHEMLLADGKEAKIAGNIGLPACEVAKSVNDKEYMITEVSSFQLKGTLDFRPRIAALLNIFDAHLDYHGTRTDYIRSKANIAGNLTADDYFVYNAEDEVVKGIATTHKGKNIPFSVQQRRAEGASHEEGIVYWQNEPLVKTDDIALPGTHNLENALAAVAIAKLLDVSNDTVKSVLAPFAGVEHRLQFVKELHGRKVYNDSKATNILATSRALAAFRQPIVLIAGGLDRGNDFSALAESFSNVKAMAVYGETAEKLKEAGARAGVPLIKHTARLQEAVKEAYEATEEGDILLLSPACASWDQFKTFEERGEHFINAIKEL